MQLRDPKDSAKFQKKHGYVDVNVMLMCKWVTV